MCLFYSTLGLEENFKPSTSSFLPPNSKLPAFIHAAPRNGAILHPYGPRTWLQILVKTSFLTNVEIYVQFMLLYFGLKSFIVSMSLSPFSFLRKIRSKFIARRNSSLFAFSRIAWVMSEQYLNSFVLYRISVRFSLGSKLVLWSWLWGWSFNQFSEPFQHFRKFVIGCVQCPNSVQQYHFSHNTR